MGQRGDADAGGRRVKTTLVELLGYFIAALFVLILLPIGILLMIAFTVVDAISRVAGRLRKSKEN